MGKRSSQRPPVDWYKVPVIFEGTVNPVAWKAILDAARRFEESQQLDKLEADRRAAIEPLQEAAEIAKKSDQVVGPDFSI